jgi:hypothetical protein
MSGMERADEVPFTVRQIGAMNEIRLEFLLTLFLAMAWLTLWTLWHGQIILEVHAQVSTIIQEMKLRELLIHKMARSICG